MKYLKSLKYVFLMVRIQIVIFILLLLILLSDKGGKFALTSPIYLKNFGLPPLSLWEAVFLVVLLGNMFIFGFYPHKYPDCGIGLPYGRMVRPY